MLTNPLLLMQSRFIIQNRLPNFCTYKSSLAFFKKSLIRPKVYTSIILSIGSL